MLRIHGGLRPSLTYQYARICRIEQCRSSRWASTKRHTDETGETVIKKPRKSSKAAPKDEDSSGREARPKRKPGRPLKHIIPNDAEIVTEEAAFVPAEAAITSNAATVEDTAEPKRKRKARPKSKVIEPPPRLLPPPSRHHNDLESFLAYAARTNLTAKSSVYRGTHYEYTCINTLQSPGYSLTLHRTGRANDLGIDLLGHWTLSASNGSTQRSQGQERQTIKVLAQCKASTPEPRMIRELEGAYAGAPAGWRSPSTAVGTTGVLALLISTGEVTKGVQTAMQRSRWPMGFLQISPEGVLRQFLWNNCAASVGLEGVGVTPQYEERDGKMEERLVLTWMGRAWKD